MLSFVSLKIIRLNKEKELVKRNWQWLFLSPHQDFIILLLNFVQLLHSKPLSPYSNSPYLSHSHQVNNPAFPSKKNAGAIWPEFLKLPTFPHPNFCITPNQITSIRLTGEKQVHQLFLEPLLLFSSFSPKFHQSGPPSVSSLPHLPSSQSTAMWFTHTDTDKLISPNEMDSELLISKFHGTFQPLF